MIKKYNITVNGKSYEVEVEEVGVSPSQNTKSQEVAKAPPVAQPKVSKAPQQTSTPAPSVGNNIVNAPMPGTIFEIKVNVGEQVKKGDVLLILEAMKMENEIMAPNDGVVSHIHVSKGSSVSSGDALITLG